MVRSATHIRAATAVIASLLLLAGCGSDHISGANCNSVSIDPVSPTMFVGDTLRLQGVTTMRNQNGDCETSATALLNWTTDSESVEITSGANATAWVIVAATQPGTATVHATSAETGKAGISVITVREH